MHFVNTDYGTVFLSAKTLNWLNTLWPEWESVINNKRKTGRKSRFIKAKFNDLTVAVNVASAIAYLNNENMTEY